jgi:fatty acid desaturase
VAVESTALVEGRLPKKGDWGRHIYTVDWPTLTLAFTVYIAFFLLTWNYAVLPWWILLPAGTVVIALQGSLQHEAVHGYPTRWASANLLIAGWSLWLWLPYQSYEATHLKHHMDEDLTDPFEDPESNYLTPLIWSRMSPLHRMVRGAMRTLGGRIVLGPGYFAVMTWRGLFRGLYRMDTKRLRPWAWHFVTMALILYWVMGVCGMPLWLYVLCFAYPGTSLTLIRSYAEHRAATETGKRTAIIEAGPFWSLMFLNNNLHAMHHAEPGLAWYRRPVRYREMKARLLAENGHYFIRGYGALAAGYLLKPKEPLFHPHPHMLKTSVEVQSAY